MPNPTEEQGTDLREYLRVLKARKIEVLAVALALLALTIFFSLRQTPIYEGETKVLVRPPSPTGLEQIIPQAPNLDTERQLVLSQAVVGKVKKDQNLTESIEEIQDDTRVEVVTDTEVLVIKYLDPNAERSASVANAFADAYIDFRREQALAEVEAARTDIEERKAEVQGQLTYVSNQMKKTGDPGRKQTLQAQRDSLVASLGVLQQELIGLSPSPEVLQGAGQVVQEAMVPNSPASPNLLKNGILALLAGLALGVGFAFLRERLDDRTKSREQLEHDLGAPVLANVPRVMGWKKPEDAQLVVRSDPKSPTAETYRTLATNIQYLASRSPMKVLMVTSALGGEGKTTTSSDLAVALASAGRRVMLLSADLRRPRIHTFFGLSNDVGLSNLLEGTAELPQVTQDPGIKNLRVVVSGPIPERPAELLSSFRTGEILEMMRDLSDLVLIDTPPVLAVADASILAPLVDGTLFVVDATRSSRAATRQAKSQLINAGATITGVVYNNFDASKEGAYGYYQSYYEPVGAPSVNGQGKLLSRLPKLRRAAH